MTGEPPATRSAWRRLIAPAIATLVGMAILIGLGVWQLERKVWKEDLLAKMDARAHGTPVPLQPRAEWPRWNAGSDEYARVRLSGRFEPRIEIPVHGLAKPGWDVVPGFFVFSPLRLADGATVMVNRGFVPPEFRDPASRPPLPEGEVTIVGLERAPEMRGAFVPKNDPPHAEWFVRDSGEMARVLGLASVAPFYIDAGATPNPGGWPKGGQTQLTLKNDHLQYAITWFGLAASLLGVFAVFAWKRVRPDGSADRSGSAGTVAGRARGTAA